MKKIPLTTSNRFALVDEQDYELISKYTWYLGRDGYPETRTRKVEGKRLVRMHHFILKSEKEDVFVDHANMNGCDNRRINLRLVTKSQNMMNRNAPKQNTSGFKGVTWCKITKKWRAQIQCEGKHHCLGRHRTKEAAAKAYNEAAPIYHKSYARLNIV